MPMLLATRASVPTALPMARKSVLLNDVDVVMPAGNEVGHLTSPLASRKQHLGAPAPLLLLNFW